MSNWVPSDKQKSGPIAKTFNSFVDELCDLQDELDCPDKFIFEFLEIIRNRWSPDSCHAKARLHKRSNPSVY